MTHQRIALLLIAFFATLIGTSGRSLAQQEMVLRLPMGTTGPNSVDPVRGSSVYDNKACNYVYETLLEYEYFKRPYELKPCLLAQMPDVSEDGKTFTFRLRDDIYFHDDPCFTGGKGRNVNSDDVFYSLKRMADTANEPKGWWLLKDTIVGFDEYRDAQNAAEQFDYDAPVEGMVRIGDYDFQIVLKEPFYRFAYTLAMFQTSVVPREAVEFYGKKFSRNPVGTGPFVLADWESGARMTFTKNPTYREVPYPADPGLNADGSEPYEGYSQHVAMGMYEDAGKLLPLADRVVVTMFATSQPAWLKFLNRELDYTTVPSENFTQAYIKRNKKLRQEMIDRGVRSVPVPLLDMIYNGFNMEDPVYGGYDEKRKKLRQAIALTYDFEEVNQAYYQGGNLIYDGPIPDGLDGHPEGHSVPNNYRGPNIPRAKRLLAEAGYPGGDGLEPLVYYTSKQPQSIEMAMMTKRNLSKIGVNMDVRTVDFSTLSEKLRSKAAPFFGLAWGSDYPDAENNLQLFYGPFKSPMSNNFNYDRPEYNAMYEKIRVMQPSEERTKIYEQMRDMIIEDVPMIGSMARTRHYLIHDRLKNFVPVETFSNWPKYLKVE